LVVGSSLDAEGEGSSVTGEPGAVALPFGVDLSPTGDAGAICAFGDSLPQVCSAAGPSGFGGMFEVYRPFESLCDSADVLEARRRSLAMGLDHQLLPYPADDPDTGNPDPLVYPSGSSPSVVLEGTTLCAGDLTTRPNTHQRSSLSLGRVARSGVEPRDLSHGGCPAYVRVAAGPSAPAPLGRERPVGS
jgi:hypothetical protein